MRTLVIGDIHGNAKGLQQVLKKSKFNPKKDKLIQLGDVGDGWSETSECVDILLNIQDKSSENNKPIFIRGNHDVWVYDWIKYGEAPLLWTQQGGKSTLDSYIRTKKFIEDEHRDFWYNQQDWYIDDKNRLFIHAGWYFPSGFPKGANSKVNAGTIARECHWDRGLFETCRSAHLMRKNNPDAFKNFNPTFEFEEVYIGHTARNNGPENYLNLWNLDTGSGWNGKLTIMDIDTKECWQSDLSTELYPNEKGR